MALGVVVWLSMVIAAYYVVHKPWQPENLRSGLESLFSLWVALAVACLAGGVGHRLMQNKNNAVEVEFALLQFSLGMGVIGFTVFILGLLDVLFRWLFWIALFIGIIILRKDITGWLRAFRRLFIWGEYAYFEKGLFCFVVIVLGLNLTRSLAPPTKWDALVYHLELPRQYLRAGGITPEITNLYSGFPQLASMVYVFAMGLFKDTTALLSGWMVGLIALCGLEGFSRNIFGKRVKWLAPSILMSGSSLSQAFSWGYADVWLLLFGVCVVICLQFYDEYKEREWIFMAGVYGGFLLSTKYTAVLSLFVFGMMILTSIFVDRFLHSCINRCVWELIQKALRDGLIFGLVAFLVFLPWLIKNYEFTGFPFYPFGWLGRGDSGSWFQLFQMGQLQERGLLADVLLPWEATIFGVESAVVQGKPAYFANIDPLLLALAPAALIRGGRDSKRWNSNLKKWLIPSLLTWLLWGCVAHFSNEAVYTRHYYGLFPIFSLLAVAGFCSISTIQWPQVRLSRVVETLVSLSLALSIFSEISLFILQNPLPVILGFESKTAYLERSMGSYAEFMEALRSLPEDRACFMFWEPRVYYCERECFLDGTLHNWWYLKQDFGDGSQIAQALRQQGFTCVGVYDLGLEWARNHTGKEDVALYTAFDQFVQDHLILINKIGQDYSIYEVVE